MNKLLIACRLLLVRLRSRRPALAEPRRADSQVVVRTADLDLGQRGRAAPARPPAGHRRRRSVRRRRPTSTSPAATRSAAAATKRAPASPPTATGWSQLASRSAPIVIAAR